jgi:hypothetical protein
MPLGLKLLGNAPHDLGHALLNIVCPGDQGCCFGKAAKLAQQPGLAHAALARDADDEAAARVFGRASQIFLEKPEFLLAPDKIFLLASFKDVLKT